MENYPAVMSLKSVENYANEMAAAAYNRLSLHGLKTLPCHLQFEYHFRFVTKTNTHTQLCSMHTRQSSVTATLSNTNKIDERREAGKSVRKMCSANPTKSHILSWEFCERYGKVAMHRGNLFVSRKR